MKKQDEPIDLDPIPYWPIDLDQTDDMEAALNEDRWARLDALALAVE